MVSAHGIKGTGFGVTYAMEEAENDSQIAFLSLEIQCQNAFIKYDSSMAL